MGNESVEKPRKFLGIIVISGVIILILILIGGYFLLTNQSRESKLGEEVVNNTHSNYLGKKVLYVDSYHEGYGWSDGISSGVINSLPEEVQLESIHMDTKNNPEEEFKQQAALKVKEKIGSYKPDVVIACDDNAFKYVIQKYYRDSDLPFVFCGVNWDLSAYEGPYTNTAGMIEVALIKQIGDYMEDYSKGERVGVLTGDVLSEHKNVKFWARELGNDFDKVEYVKTFEEWKAKYLELQDSVDMLFIGSSAGVKGWDEEGAKSFVLENTKIPTGCELDTMMPYSLLGLTKVAEEQGEWSANAALEILDGKSPSEIGVVKNQKGNLMLNLELAGKMGIVFSPSMLTNAKILDEDLS